MYDENASSYGGPIKYKGPYKWDDTGVCYVEFDWSGYKVYGTRELQFALVGAQDENYKFHWDPTNDFSRQGITNKFEKTPYIAVFLGDELVYGQQPPKGVPTPTPSGNPADLKPSIKVLYKTTDASDAAGDIKVTLKIENTGKKPVDLSTLKIRYWYTKDSDDAQECIFDYVKIGKEMVEAKFVDVSPAVENADNYLEIGFKSGAGVIAPGSDSGDIQFRVTKNGAKYTVSNDYSYDKSTSFTENSKITAYINSELIYGEEPDGVGPVVTPTPTPNDYIFGDVNGDKEVNSIDFAIMKQFLLGMIKEFPYEHGAKAGDLNGDGNINSIDYALLKQYILGIIKEFPIEQ